MTDGAVHALEEKMNKCIVNWQSAEQHVQKRNAAMPKVLEAANVTLLVMNLAHVPVASLSAELQGLEPEKVKDHKGTRTTFLVLKVLSPGWTWVNGTEKENKNSNAMMMQKGARGGKAPEPAVIKDKLNAMLGEHVLMHSYATVQSRGTYTRAGRAAEYLLLSPGMVLSMMVWGRGFLNVFKQQTDDLCVFDIGIMQMGIKSIGCAGADSGNMLEVKTFVRNNHPGINLFSTRLFPSLPTSLLESAAMRTRFLEGSHVENGETFGESKLKQDWVKGTMSSTVSVVKVSAQGGTFAIGPDDVLRFHVAQPLADLPCAQMTVRCDPSVFGNEADKDWVCKLLNVLALIDAVELVVVMDSYKTTKLESEGEDTVLEGVARVDMNRLIGSLLALKPQHGSEVGFVKETFGDAAKAMAVYKVTPEVSIAFDARLLTKKRSATPDGAKTTLVHPASTWERGHAVHFFFGGRLVHFAVVPLVGDGCGLDGSKHVLSTIAAPVKWDELDVEVEAPADVPPAVEAPPAAEKEKKRKQRPVATEGDA